jgi:hypothetical protein
MWPWAWCLRRLLIATQTWPVQNVPAPVRRYVKFLWGFSVPQGRVSVYEYPRHHLTVRVLVDLLASKP